MKPHFCFPALLFGFLFAPPTVCQAQWGPDEPLTDVLASTTLSYSNARCVAASGQSVHVVWYDDRSGNTEIYYKRSTDGGVSSGADIRLTNNPGISWLPSLSVLGSDIHVVWYDDRDGNFEIYYRKSIDSGTNWGAETRLTNNLAPSGYPSVFADGSVVHVVWGDTRDGGGREIYYKRSTDGGNTWGVDTRLTNNSGDSHRVSVSASGSDVHVLWLDDRDGNYEVYYKRSADGGSSWGADTRLTNTLTISEYGSISSSGSVVHVVWTDGSVNTRHIFHKHSTDRGLTWQADVQLTDSAGVPVAPSVAVSDSIVHVVWQDNRHGNGEIYYKRSLDRAVTWGTDFRLTYNSASSESPFVAASGSAIHVVWQDNREGKYAIYYKRNPTGILVGIENTNSEIPKEFALYQNYPNPFNPSTRIQFSVPHSSYVSLKVYNLLGQEVAALVSRELTPGKYNTQWFADQEASGIYFYRLEAGSFAETKKLILLR